VVSGGDGPQAEPARAQQLQEALCRVERDVVAVLVPVVVVVRRRRREKVECII
jgi:hypothetical protein